MQVECRTLPLPSLVAQRLHRMFPDVGRGRIAIDSVSAATMPTSTMPASSPANMGMPVLVNSTALTAAGAVHSDFEKKFIRAEVVNWKALREAGGYAGARERGIPVPHGAYVNICGSDLIRNEAGDFVVLEDNLRVPSGVSYMLANRDAARRTFPGTFRQAGVRTSDEHPGAGADKVNVPGPDRR